MYVYRMMMIMGLFAAQVPSVSAAESQPEASEAEAEVSVNESAFEEADGPRDKIAEQAVQAFKRGTYHFSRGEYVLAAEAFRLADQLRPNWKILYNLAQSEAAAKRYGLALEAFEAYLVRGGDEVPAHRKASVLRDVEQFRQLVGALEIVAPDGASILVDDVPRGTAPLSGMVLVSAGVDHRLQIRIEGELYAERTVKVSGEMQRLLDLSQRTTSPEVSTETSAPEPRPASSPEDGAAPVSRRNNGMFVAGLTLTGVGGASLIAGVVTGALALAEDSELEPICSDDGCPSDKQGDVQKMENLALSTNVLLAVGGTAAVAGVVLTVLAKRRGKNEEQISLSPMVGPSLAGGILSWRF